MALERALGPFRPTKTLNRWNTADVQVAYGAEHLALAALELLTYWGGYPTMSGYQLFTLDLEPQNVENLSEAQSEFDPKDYARTRPYGDTWVREGRSLALKVPSVVVPMSYNYVINPAHSAFDATRIVAHGAFEYDDRLARLVEAAKNS